MQGALARRLLLPGVAMRCTETACTIGGTRDPDPVFVEMPETPVGVVRSEDEDAEVS